MPSRHRQSRREGIAMSRDPKEVAAIDPALRNVIAHIELSTMQVELLKMILTNTYLQGLKDGVALAMEPSHARP